ncbi:MAG: hypothetical protein WC718_18960 [Phycisphaerales bacterium]|jgi:hypothetical protein
MINLFGGYDSREGIGFHLFVHSVLKRASAPVAVSALMEGGVPVGTNAFTYSRFLVPWLMDFKGHAIFADAADMVMLGDIAELDALFDPNFAVQVVQHPNYSTKNRVKYIGTSMECPNRDYARKNWASLMIFNCEHPYWRPVTPEALATISGLSLLQFGGLRLREEKGMPPEVGVLPPQWNRLADEGHPTDDAKVLHWTAGIPGFKHYENSPAAQVWRDEFAEMLRLG